VIALTGATSGIGRRAAVTLAERGATVAAVGRNRERGEALAAESDAAAGTIRFHRADLATQSAVRDLAAELRESYDRLDVLAHNAGLSVRSRTETADGIELTLAVNHLAPYLLTRELFDQLAGSAPARVVVTASDLHRRATLDFDDLQFADGYDPLEAYARSKLANVAFTLELADRIPEAAGVTANCLHPGFVPRRTCSATPRSEPGSRSASRGSCPASGRRAEPRPTASYDSSRHRSTPSEPVATSARKK